jgi:hypothetical protein
MAHLQTMAGGAVVLSTEQLSRCLSMNPKVISRMRQEGRFPIPHKTIGARKIIYPIGMVADYLLETQPVTEVKRTSISVHQDETPKRRATVRKAMLPDLSRQMLLRGFWEAVVQQKQLLAGIETTLQRRLAYDDLSSSLPVSSPSVGEPKIQSNDVKPKMKI